VKLGNVRLKVVSLEGRSVDRVEISILEKAEGGVR
jgi:hypothetical protein